MNERTTTALAEDLCVSIITPSFNQGTFLDETIRSVLGQEGAFFLDYIIMDGGSTDESPGIIRRYEALLKASCATVVHAGAEYFVSPGGEFPWVKCRGVRYRWKSEQDRGQVHALKKGFRMAEGEILNWLNSDDVFVDSGVLQRVCERFREDPGLKLLTGDGPFITKDGRETGVHHVAGINVRELLFLDYHILQPSTFFRSDIYDEGMLDEGFTCAFDADFFIGMILRGIRYRKVDDRYGAFRFYPENKTLGLGRKRFGEQQKIAWKYSKNIVFFVVSTLYRYCAIVLSPRFEGRSSIFDTFLVKLRRFSYRVITGSPERQGA